MDLISVKEEPCETEEPELPDDIKKIWSLEADAALHIKTEKDLEENQNLDVEISNINGLVNCDTNSTQVTNSEAIQIEIKQNSEKIPDKSSTLKPAETVTWPHSSKTIITEVTNEIDIKNIELELDPVEKRCLICGYTNQRLDRVKEHMLVYHYGVKKFPCTKCEKRYVTKVGLDAHIFRYHRTEFEDLSQVLTHKILNCEECDYQTVSLERLKSHYVTEHKAEATQHVENYKCNQCEYRSHVRAHVAKHEIIHTGTKFYNCTFCETGYNVKSQLENHVLRKHKNNCGNLDEHVTREILYCGTCPYETLDKRAMRLHKLTHDDKHTELELLKCTTCSFTSHNKRKMSRHVQRHIEAKPYKCTECDKGFAGKKSLDYHVVKCHAKDKPELEKTVSTKLFKCERCSDVFMKLIWLQNHQKKKCGP